MHKKKFLPFLLGLLLYFLTAVAPSFASAAPRLYFDPAAPTVSKNTEFEVKVQIDVETQSAFGADAVVNYTPADLTLVSVASGGFFTDFAQSQTTGRVELHGYFSAVFDSKSGSGTLATLKFTSPKDSGASSVTFTCSGSGNDTQILDSNGNNILNCGSVNQGNITFSSSSQTTPTPGDQTVPSPTPNSCGGTCGSNYNCKSGLYCYQGFCRNPACSVDTDCVCSVTKASATPKPTTKPKPTPQSIALAPYVSPTPEPEVTPVPEEEKEVKGPIGVEVIAIVVILAALGVGALWLLKKIKGRGKPPYINMSEGSPSQNQPEKNPPAPPAPPAPPTPPQPPTKENEL